MEQNYIQNLPCKSTYTVTDRTLLVFPRFYVKLYIISLCSMQLLVYINLPKFVASPHVKTQIESRVTSRHTARLLTIMWTLCLEPSKTTAVPCWTLKSSNIKCPIVTTYTCRSTKFEHLYNLFHCLSSSYLFFNHITVRFSRCPNDLNSPE